MTVYRAILCILVLYVALDLALPSLLGASQLAPDEWVDSAPAGRDRASAEPAVELLPPEPLPALPIRTVGRPAPLPRHPVRRSVPIAEPRARSMLTSAPLERSDPH